MTATKRPKSRRANHTCAACGSPIGQREPYYFATVDCLLYYVHAGCYGRFTEAKRTELARVLGFLGAFELVDAS